MHRREGAIVLGKTVGQSPLSAHRERLENDVIVHDRWQSTKGRVRGPKAALFARVGQEVPGLRFLRLCRLWARVHRLERAAKRLVPDSTYSRYHAPRVSSNTSGAVYTGHTLAHSAWRRCGLGGAAGHWCRGAKKGRWEQSQLDTTSRAVAT